MSELQGTSELPGIIYEIICTYKYMNFLWDVRHKKGEAMSGRRSFTNLQKWGRK